MTRSHFNISSATKCKSRSVKELMIFSILIIISYR
nr:MAG TPA: hypothetical protein [Bacteriophage sp.]